MAKMDEKEEKNWAMLCHLSALASIIGPLIVWSLKKENSPLIDDQGKESLNFQITMTIAAIVARILMVVFIGFLLMPALLIFDLIMIIIASIKASEGEKYRYPVNIRFIK